MNNLPDVQAGREALRRDLLVRTGAEVIEAGQSASGAFVACPTFPVYQYAWLRDGSFCALALDVVGNRAAATRFHNWVARTLRNHQRDIERAIATVADAGSPVPPQGPRYLPTRYTLDGESERNTEEAWPNFQLDGYGMWLTVVAAHWRQAPVPSDICSAVRLAADYLAAMWRTACYDCWEEFGDQHHTATLLAVADGLNAAGTLLHDAELQRTADTISASIYSGHVSEGRLTKSRDDKRVDASLLWAAVPSAPSSAAHALTITATVAAVEAELVGPSGGVRRYLGDSYYGGGEWLLLTSWLGWHAAITGKRGLAERCDSWVRNHATASGGLPEQATDHAQFPDMVAPWTAKWGPSAEPLLWSHAMQMIHSAAMVQAGWAFDV